MLLLLLLLLQVVSLITIEVHARDVIDKLCKANCTSANDFEWVSQLRFYWDKDLNDCVVKQVDGWAGLDVWIKGMEAHMCIFGDGVLVSSGADQFGGMYDEESAKTELMEGVMSTPCCLSFLCTLTATRCLTISPILNDMTCVSAYKTSQHVHSSSGHHGKKDSSASHLEPFLEHS